MANDDRPVLIYTTFPRLDDAKRVGDALVAARLAACVNMFPGMISIFEWKGAREEASEVAMIIKTRASLDRGRARRDQAAASLRAAGAARAADRGRQRRILRLDRRARRQAARAQDERRALSSSPSIRGRPARAPSCSTARAGRAPPRNCRSRRSIPRRGRSSTIPRRSGGRCFTSAAPCSAKSGRAGRRHRHHQSARDDGRVGAGDRQAARQCHRLAGPPHRPTLRRADARGLGRACRGSDRARHRSLFLGDQARLAARQRAGARSARARRARCASAPSTASCCSGSPGAGCTQPTRPTPPAPCSTTSGRGDGTSGCSTGLRVPRAMLPEVRDSQSDFGAHRARAFRRCDSHHGRGRRPAGGGLRAGLLHARHAQGDLRHRLLRARQYRRGESGLGHAHALDHLPSARRQAHLRAGRRDLHGRRDGAMAARQSRPHRLARRRARRWRGRPTRIRASISFPPFRDSARRSGMRARGLPFSG